MSFWSRNKNKKETSQPSGVEKPSPKVNTTTIIPSANGPPSTSSPTTTVASQHSISSVRTNGTTGPSSPPSSPSTIIGSKMVGGGTNQPFPWSMRKFRNANPFPRFGHAANVSAGKEGEVYIFGGLVKDKRKNDLFVIDSGSMTAYNISATGDGPSPRLGHAAILVGNAFIVFGGECATTDLSHDDSLYLLNTSTRQWTRAVTVGPRPAPRYGHTLNILGSRLLVFGGQVDGYYFNDLVTFDLNTLSSPNARWELVQAITDPPSARTGHVCMSLGDKLIIFGGTDGLQWFNDTWFFDARSNSWLEVECTGHTPSPREGHAGALIGDVMYIFGGRGSDGKMLSDLYAFKIGSRRWFSFAAMGPGPSPRCGHTLTTSRDKVIVLGGESATNVAGKDESTVAFVLDTSRIRFPSDGKSTSKDRVRNLTSPIPQGERQRPSSRGNAMTGSVFDTLPSNREESRIPRGPPRIRSPSPTRGGSLPSRGSGERRHTRSPSSGSSGPQQTTSLRGRPTSPLTPQTTGMATNIPSERNFQKPSPQLQQPPHVSQQSPQPPHIQGIKVGNLDAFNNRDRVETIEKQDDEVESTRGDQSPDEPKHSETHHDDQSNASIQSSPRVDTLTESLKKRLAWATTELALAQSRGYTPSPLDEDDDIADILGKNDIQVKDTRLLQALLSTRHQLARVKDLVKDQTRTASERISEAERQRDEALSDAAYARARLAAANVGEDMNIGVVQSDRAAELGRKLVTALSMQNDLSIQVDALSAQLTTEKAARQMAEDKALTHLDKFNDADQRRSEGWTRLEEVRSQLVEAQRISTDERAKSVDREAVANNLRVENDELKKQVAEFTDLMGSQTLAVEAAKAAVVAAVERAEYAEKTLTTERAQRSELEREIMQLKQELGTVDSQRSEIENLELQLARAKEEADSARNVMLNGLDKLVSRPTPTSNTVDYDGRIRTLQDHLEATRSLHSESRETADAAVRDLSKANERIATLESAQAQHVRETATLQSRLSESLDQLHILQDEHNKVRSRMTEVQRDLDASYVKHTAIKQLFSERPSSASPMRSTTVTPEFSNKLRDLERQLDDSQRLREEMEQTQEQVMQNLSVASKRHKEATRRQREAEDRVKKLEDELERTSNPSAAGSASAAEVAEATKRQIDAERKLADSTVVFQERLAQLEADYESAVHYVKGTEKMIRRMKEELTKYKSQNAFLQTELHELKRQSLRGMDEQGWDAEKERLMKEIETIQLAQRSEATSASEQMKKLQTRLDQHAEERDVLKIQLANVQKELQAASERSKQVETELERLKNDDGDKSRLESDLVNSKALSKRLEQENQVLETRALEAEEKVSLLLDQVENSVDTYRRSIVPKRADGSPPISPRSSSVGNRTSVALDSLAHELDQLRSHWESSTQRYRLSTTSSLGHESPTHTTGLGLMPSFEFETPKTADSSDRNVNGIHQEQSSSRWRDDIGTQSHVRQVTA